MSPGTLPTPERLSALQLWRYFNNPRAFAAELRTRHGALAPVRVPGGSYVLVLTPDAALQVFAHTPNNYEAFWHESFAGMNGEGSLWVLAGEAHRRERKLFAPAVHAGHFRAYGEVIRDVARSHFSSWQPGQKVKAVDTTKAIALDVIMRLVFGVEDDQMMEEGRRVLDRLTSTAHPLIVFYPKLQRPWFPLFRRYLRAKAAMYDWAARLISQRRARGAAGEDVLVVQI
jgi:cytochrome P450